MLCMMGVLPVSREGGGSWFRGWGGAHVYFELAPQPTGDFFSGPVERRVQPTKQNSHTLVQYCMLWKEAQAWTSKVSDDFIKEAGWTHYFNQGGFPIGIYIHIYTWLKYAVKLHKCVLFKSIIVYFLLLYKPGGW